MGMGVFTGGFQNWDMTFTIVAFVSCLIGRAVNIFPLSFIANLCRERSNKITPKTQVVLWFAGLRGAIAFALSESMVRAGAARLLYCTVRVIWYLFSKNYCLFQKHFSSFVLLPHF
jgi:sodium/hydrogen exchanger 8